MRKQAKRKSRDLPVHKANNGRAELKLVFQTLSGLLSGQRPQTQGAQM